jgi:hypothetical protein
MVMTPRRRARDQSGASAVQQVEFQIRLSKTRSIVLAAAVALGAQGRAVACSTAKLPTTNSVALVRERTLLTERPLLVGEVSPKFC